MKKVILCIATLIAANNCYTSLDYPEMEYDPMYYSHDENLAEGYSLLGATKETLAEMKEIFVDSFMLGNEHPI